MFFVSKGRDGSPFSADVAQGWKNTHLQMQLDLLCLFKFLNVQRLRGTIKGLGQMLIYSNKGLKTLKKTYFEDFHGLPWFERHTPAWPDCGRGTEFLLLHGRG